MYFFGKVNEDQKNFLDYLLKMESILKVVGNNEK